MQNNKIIESVLTKHLNKKEVSERALIFSVCNDENRIRLSLSPFAWSVIDNDIQTFGLKNRNAAANQIFKAMWDYYNDNYEKDYVFAYQSLEKYSKDVLSLTQDRKATQAYLAAKKEMIDEYVAALKPTVCGFSKLIVLSKDNMNLLCDSSECYEAEYYGESHLSLFFICVLESYARKTHRKREKIMLNKKINIIENAIENDRLLEITTYSNTKNREYTFIARPFKIVSEPITTHLYLTCFSYEKGDDESNEKIASFRLSRVSKISEKRKKANLKNSKTAKRKIEQAIKERGVAYLLSEPSKYIIALTQNGMNMYNTIMTYRPAFSSKEKNGNNYRLSFECTKKQICDYFFKFGKDVEIIYPTELRNDFITAYMDAIEVYKKDTNIIIPDQKP